MLHMKENIRKNYVGSLDLGVVIQVCDAVIASQDRDEV